MKSEQCSLPLHVRSPITLQEHLLMKESGMKKKFGEGSTVSLKQQNGDKTIIR